MEVPKRKADEKVDTDFDVPDRSALRDQIRAIDSWLEEDTGREDVKGVTARPRQSAARAPATLQEAMARGAGDGDDSAAEAELFSKLEALKSRETVPPAEIKELVNRAKPLLPGMNLEQLVRALDLFSSSYEDHDFYLHILGELPVQVRSITCELLTKCLCILQRLRLNEETYLELFSMQAMNMIRAQQPAAARAPRAPRRPGEAKEVPKATLAPFSGRMLVQMGNSLTQLAAKHPSRFMDVFQEQLALAIPLLSKEDCELVSPALATSQLMPDALRRAFLERCAEVDAGSPLVAPDDAVAPDIAKYQQDAEIFRRRSHSFRNIFVIEASLRKETWAFFTSLPAEVRSYLDRVQDTCKELRHQGANSFAKQVAEVLGQLGVVCELNRMAGPLELHLVVKAVGDTEIVYECCEADAYCAARQDQRTSPPTVETKLRQKLLQRMGYQLVHMNVWEWNRLSEAQRINYMVKLQSLPA
ncbi:unnamed protein product [Effrenium voratum]|nr:unnamed protein product [Effrenium voratum]